MSYILTYLDSGVLIAAFRAKYYKQQNEIEFYEAFFSSCQKWANNLNQIVELAENLASKYGLNALDALQNASAISIDATEFITTEKSTKPLHRVTEIKVISAMDFSD